MCEQEVDVPECYALSWELSKTVVEKLPPVDAAGTVVAGDDHAGGPVAVCPEVFSYRIARVNGLFLCSLLFWEAFMFCMAFSEPE